MIRRRTNQKGYTLLELMLVLVIIGVMIAIAFPNVERGIRRRKLQRATHDVARVLNAARTRAVQTGRAHMIRYTDSDALLLPIYRGDTNLCNTSNWAGASTTCAGDMTVCRLWWRSTDYSVTGGGFHFVVNETEAHASFDLCFEGNGVTYWRLGTTGRFADDPGTGLHGAFRFEVTSPEYGADVPGHVLLPFGGSARKVP